MLVAVFSIFCLFTSAPDEIKVESEARRVVDAVERVVEAEEAAPASGSRSLSR